MTINTSYKTLITFYATLCTEVWKWDNLSKPLSFQVMSILKVESHREEYSVKEGPSRKKKKVFEDLLWFTYQN